MVQASREELHSGVLPKLPVEIGDFNKNRSVMSVAGYYDNNS